MKIICPSCGADFELNQDQALAEGLQIKCPACLHVFMAYEDGSTSSVGEARTEPDDESGNSLLPPPPPPPPRAANPSAPPPLPSDSSGDSDVFDFSFGNSTESGPPVVDRDTADVGNGDSSGFDFSFGLQNEAPPVQSSTPESSSPLGNLFDDLDDLPQPKVADAELPTPRGVVDLPGVKGQTPIESIEEENIDASVGLQAPELVTEQPLPEASPNLSPLPETPKFEEQKRSGGLYLVLGGTIFLGVVCSALYFGGLLDPSSTSKTPVVRKPTINKTPKVVQLPVESSSSSLAQVRGFMDKLKSLELNVKEEDAKTVSELTLYFALAALQFEDHIYFNSKSAKLSQSLAKDDQSSSALAVRLAVYDAEVDKVIAARSAAAPNDAILQLLAAYAAQRKGELSAAVSNFQTAYKLDPNFLQAVRQIAHIQLRRGEYAAAEKSVEVLEMKIPKSFPALFFRALLEYERPNGNLERAKKTLEKTVGLKEQVRVIDLAEAHVLRAKILRREGDVDGAIDDLAKAARLAPRNEELLGLLGSLYFEKNQYDRALKQIRQIEKDGKSSPELMVLKADCFRRMAQPRKAIEIIEEAKEKYPEAVSVLLFEGDLRTEQRNYLKAEEVYGKAIELSPKEVGIQLKLAKLLMAQSKIESAKALLESKIQAAPNSPELLIGYARMRKQLGDIGGGKVDYVPARIHYQKALRLDASLIDARLEQIDVLIKLGEILRAERELGRIMMSEHLRGKIAYLTARIKSHQNKHDDALTSYRVARPAYAENPDFLVSMARSAFHTKSYDLSMELLNIAKRIDNKQAETYLFMGRTAFEKNQHSSAIRHLTQAIKLNGQDTRHRYWLARAYLERNELAKARKEFDRIIKQTKQSKQFSAEECDTFFRRASMLRDEGLSSWPRAIRELNSHIACRKDNAEAFLVRGQIRADYKYFEKAKQDYARATELARSSNRPRIGALAHYESARVLKRSKRFETDDLLKILNRAVDTDASFAPPHRDLCVLLRQSDRKNAKSHCKAYLKAAPDGLYATEVREVLRNL